MTYQIFILALQKRKKKKNKLDQFIRKTLKQSKFNFE